MSYPKSFQKLMEHFSSLPSVGPKMAERLVLHLFKQDKDKIKNFSENLSEIQNLKSCSRCHNIADGDLCEICKNSKRDKHLLCIVEEPLDIISIERTRAYNGLYHVLGGTITMAKDEGKNLTISQLLKRIKKEGIEEIILAFNPTTEGDTTGLYLKRKLQPTSVKITRLAKGLSTGGDIEYADEATLSAALTNRQELL